MDERSIAAWTDYSQEAVVFDQTEVLSPNATVFMQGGRIEVGMDLMTVSSKQGPTICHDLLTLL
jgi:hypothetical protein